LFSSTRINSGLRSSGRGTTRAAKIVLTAKRKIKSNNTDLIIPPFSCAPLLLALATFSTTKSKNYREPTVLPVKVKYNLLYIYCQWFLDFLADSIFASHGKAHRLHRFTQIKKISVIG
jgi:hypothetical protein